MAFVVAASPSTTTALEIDRKRGGITSTRVVLELFSSWESAAGLEIRVTFVMAPGSVVEITIETTAVSPAGIEKSAQWTPSASLLQLPWAELAERTVTGADHELDSVTSSAA